MRSRSVAAITALWLVVCGVLALRHEAATAHVVDRAGAFVHASALSGHHTAEHSDIHGQRDPDADTGDCALLAASHQAARTPSLAPALAVTLHEARVADAPHAPRLAARSDVYRLAPKTSPPVAG